MIEALLEHPGNRFATPVAGEAAPMTAAEVLAMLPHEGFVSDGQRAELIHQIDAVGLPVDNYRSLAYQPNEKGRENVLASWGTGAENFGQFSIYKRLESEAPQERLATIAHEGAHANSALRPENAYLFGGETERADAETYVRGLASQSLITNKFMTGYQKHLASQLTEGQITFDTFAEETQAIATELAMTNRAKLVQVEASQHAEFAKMRSQGAIGPAVEPVKLISRTTPDGHTEVNGVDKQLIKLIRGVSSYEDLLQHVSMLKGQFYPEKSLAVASARGSANVSAPEISGSRLVNALAQYLRQPEFDTTPLVKTPSEKINQAAGFAAITHGLETDIEK